MARPSNIASNNVPALIDQSASVVMPSKINDLFADDIAGLRTRLLAGSNDKIDINLKQFKFPNGDTVKEIDVVIVDFVYFNQYYDSAFEKDVIKPMTCFALNAQNENLSPSKLSVAIQNTYLDAETGVETPKACASRWAMQFKSAPTGAGKACKNRILMAVLPADATAETPLLTIDLPQMSAKDFGPYVKALASGLGRPPYGVITHMSHNPSVQYVCPTFSDPQLINDADFIMMVRSRRDEARARLLTESNETSANDSSAGRLPAPQRRVGR
jgi:hypothetical protein